LAEAPLAHQAARGFARGGAIAECSPTLITTGEGAAWSASFAEANFNPLVLAEGASTDGTSSCEASADVLVWAAGDAAGTSDIAADTCCVFLAEGVSQPAFDPEASPAAIATASFAVLRLEGRAVGRSLAMASGSHVVRPVLAQAAPIHGTSSAVADPNMVLGDAEPVFGTSTALATGGTVIWADGLCIAQSLVWARGSLYYPATDGAGAATAHTSGAAVAAGTAIRVLPPISGQRVVGRSKAFATAA